VMTISSLMIGQYGVSGIAISLPTIVGRDGAEEVLNLPLSDQEVALFQRSANILKENLAHVQ